MRKLMKYAKQYTWQSIICPILMVGEVVLELMLPYYMSVSYTHLTLPTNSRV